MTGTLTVSRHGLPPLPHEDMSHRHPTLWSPLPRAGEGWGEGLHQPALSELRAPRNTRDEHRNHPGRRLRPQAIPADQTLDRGQAPRPAAHTQA